MTIQEQLINDIKQLPEDILFDLSNVAKRFILLNSKVATVTFQQNDIDTAQSDFARRFPLLGCGKGQIWIAEDFDAPLEEMEEYMS